MTDDNTDDAWFAKRRAAIRYRREHGYSDNPIATAAEHGITGYQRGCRCSDCRYAHARAQRGYRVAKQRAPVEFGA